MTYPRSTRYRLDRSVQRYRRVVIGGSPLKLFRVTDAGAVVVERIASGEPVAGSKLVDALLDAGAIHPLPAGSTFGPGDVTIVVPAHGSAGRAPSGAIVVDDGSPVPVPGATVRLASNRGPAAARNAGWAIVTTPLVAFVDTDVALPRGWLDTLLPHFDDERVALVAPRVRTPDGGTRLARYESRHSPLDLGPEPAPIRPGTRVGYVPAAAVVCRVDAVRAVAGFDERMRFGEDVDLVWRLGEAGWRCRYEPSSEVHHAARPTWRAWIEQRIGYGSSAAPLARRHRRAVAPVRMNGWSLAAWLLAIGGQPGLGVALGAGSSSALVLRLEDVPPAAAFRLAAGGTLRAGRQIAEAVRRVWWPLLAIAALRSRSARRLLSIAALAALHPLRLADDAAYSIGVWRGMLAERTIEPLVPHITAWPPRRGVARQSAAASPTPFGTRSLRSPS